MTRETQTVNATHGVWCLPDCFGCKVLTIGISASLMSSRTGSQNVIGGANYEKQLDKDRPAYARLRKEGLQPKSVIGAAKIEAQAESAFQIVSGNLKSKVRDTDIREATDRIKNDPLKPFVVPVGG